MIAPKNYPPIIQAFVITGLHGDRDIEIEFDSSIKVLVGENGLGKTTILNTLYAVLSGRFSRLEKLDFEEIKLYFKYQQVSIFQKNLNKIFNTNINELNSTRIRHQRILKSMIAFNTLEEQKDEKFYLDLKDDFIKNEVLYKEILKKIKENFSDNILYFPTYRRIEEDLKNLGYDEEFQSSEQLIQFGMTDVIERFNYITSEIKTSSVEWYSKISGQILEQLVDGIQVNDEMRERVKNKETLTIVLERLGDNIAEDRKVQIGELINDEQKIQDHKYETLIYFLSNLLRVYEQQKDKDNDIKRFAKVCNKYFIDKQFIYDESRVEMKIISKYDRQEVKLEKLSSGEKQIISIFSKLYLENNNNCAFIIDEPELSLSVEWQRQLLPDILASQKCKFLLAATHSPFIFENELDRFTSGIVVKART